LVGGDGTPTALDCVGTAKALETAFGILPLDLITWRNALVSIQVPSTTRNRQ
jgi:hypothetical protein